MPLLRLFISMYGDFQLSKAKWDRKEYVQCSSVKVNANIHVNTFKGNYAETGYKRGKSANTFCVFTILIFEFLNGCLLVFIGYRFYRQAVKRSRQWV